MERLSAGLLLPSGGHALRAAAKSARGTFPRQALPVEPAECHLGMPFARWYASNGAQGKKPTNPEMLRAMDLYRSAPGKKEAERIKIAQEIWKIVVEECWVIGTVGLSPARMGVRIVKNNMGNVPARQKDLICWNQAQPHARGRPA